MTDELRSLQLISPGVLRVDQPPRTEWVVDVDLCAVGALCLGAMVALVWRRRWT